MVLNNPTIYDGFDVILISYDEKWAWQPTIMRLKDNRFAFCRNMLWIEYIDNWF